MKANLKFMVPLTLAGAVASTVALAEIPASGEAGASNALPEVDGPALDIGVCKAATSHAGTSKVLTCSCPAEKYNSTSVWGTDFYTADSYICTTARHAGVITQDGGRVVLQMQPGLASYAGTKRNGITTRGYGKYRASYRYVRLKEKDGK